MPKKIILCADDFGQSEQISHSILKLAKLKRISAVSCMTTGQAWIKLGKELKPFHSHVDIGLHFNLTHGLSKDFRTLGHWLFFSSIRQLDRSFIEKQLNRQLDLFEQVMNQPPDFIDGHQHIHAFPIIRDVLVKVIKERFKGKRPNVRILNPMLHAADSKIKSLILKLLSCGFSRTLSAQGIRHNANFGGVYSLKANRPYRKFMIDWLRQATPNTLLMCHPGDLDHDTHDAIQAARASEYAYLMDEAFEEDCLQAKVILGTFDRP